MKHMICSRVVEKTYKSGDKIDLADIEESDMRFLYKEADGAVFMDEKTFDQITLSNEMIGQNAQWLMEEVLYHVVFYKGAPIELVPPDIHGDEDRRDLPWDPRRYGIRPRPEARGHRNRSQSPSAYFRRDEKIKVDTRTANTSPGFSDAIC